MNESDLIEAPTTKVNEPGLYQFDGKTFHKVEPSDEKKVPVSDIAFQALQHFRKEIQLETGVRLDLKIVASAMLRMAEVAALHGEDVIGHIRTAARLELESQSEKLAQKL